MNHNYCELYVRRISGGPMNTILYYVCIHVLYNTILYDLYQYECPTYRRTSSGTTPRCGGSTPSCPAWEASALLLILLLLSLLGYYYYYYYYELLLLLSADRLPAAQHGRPAQPGRCKEWASLHVCMHRCVYTYTHT